MNTYAIRLKETESLNNYADKWVALSPMSREIISFSSSAKRALEEALLKGESDPILTRIPKRFDTYIL